MTSTALFPVLAVVAWLDLAAGLARQALNAGDESVASPFLESSSSFDWRKRQLPPALPSQSAYLPQATTVPSAVYAPAVYAPAVYQPAPPVVYQPGSVPAYGVPLAYPAAYQPTAAYSPAYAPMVPTAAVRTASPASQAAVTRGGNSYSPVKYMPKEGVMMCCCAKCGSTALYEFIYASENGQAWPYEGTQPYLQDILSSRWGGTWSVPDQTQTASMLPKATFSLALVRDPIERLVSAWRSKVSCSTEGDSAGEKQKKVEGLLSLQGSGREAECLQFEDFVAVLHDILAQDKTQELDDHFIPQSNYCFKNSDPSMWSQVVSISEPGSLAQLAVHLGASANTDEDEAPAKTHGTGFHKALVMSSPAYKLLHEITAADYNLFGQFLPKEPSKTNPPPQLKQVWTPPAYEQRKQNQSQQLAAKPVAKPAATQTLKQTQQPAAKPAANAGAK